MHDFLKLLPAGFVSLIIGFVLGSLSSLVFEPMKQKRLRKEKAERARREIYRELGHLYFVFVMMDDGTVANASLFLEERLSDLKLDAYSYYYEQQRETFYDIKDWIGIKNVVLLLSEIKNDMLRNGKDPDDAIQDVIMAFATSFEAGELDSKELLKYSDISAIKRQEQLSQ